MKAEKLVMIPGPTPVTDSIQREMGRRTAAFKDPDFVQDYKGVIEDLKEMWRTGGEVFVIPGSGTVAMEMAVSNVLQAGDRVLLVSHGYFGDRFGEICSRKNYEMDRLQSEWGEIVPPERIDEQLQKKDYRALLVTHVDTSTGVKAPVEEIGEIMAGYEDTLFILDGVCATAGEREYVDPMNIDILLTGSQKAFGVPPGLAILWAGPDALARREELGEIPEYYVDFEKWLPIMHDPSQYFSTPAVNLVWALQESLRLISEEGLEERFKRHRLDADAIQSALTAIGFEILADPAHRAATLSNVIYPDGVDDEEFRTTLREQGVVVAGGLGDYAGRLFRLGHMGNIDHHIITSTLTAIERTLSLCGYEHEMGLATSVYLQERGR